MNVDLKDVACGVEGEAYSTLPGANFGVLAVIIQGRIEPTAGLVPVGSIGLS